MEAVGIQSVLTAAGIDTIINGFSQIPSQCPFEVLVARRTRSIKRARFLAEAVGGAPMPQKRRYNAQEEEQHSEPGLI